MKQANNTPMQNCEPKGYISDIFKIDINSLHFQSLKSIIPFFLNNNEFKKELFRLKLEEILFLMYSTDCGKTYFNQLRNLMGNNLRDFSNFIELNYTKKMTLEEFAKKSGKSLSAFKRDFTKVYNMPPKKWINRKRLKFAHSLLLNAGLNITEVCYECGFDNISHFINLFKKNYGITPKQLQLSQS